MNAVEKAMGLKKGEKVKLLLPANECIVVVSARWEPLDHITLDDAIKLALHAVITASDIGVTKDTVKVSVIPTETKVFRRLSAEETESYLS